MKIYEVVFFATEQLDGKIKKGSPKVTAKSIVAVSDALDGRRAIKSAEQEIKHTTTFIEDFRGDGKTAKLTYTNLELIEVSLIASTGVEIN